MPLEQQIHPNWYGRIKVRTVGAGHATYIIAFGLELRTVDTNAIEILKGRMSKRPASDKLHAND